MGPDKPVSGKPKCYLKWGRFLTEAEYLASSGKTLEQVTVTMDSTPIHSTPPPISLNERRLLMKRRVQAAAIEVYSLKKALAPKTTVMESIANLKAAHKNYTDVYSEQFPNEWVAEDIRTMSAFVRIRQD